MFRELNELLDRAKLRTKAKSERELARLLGVDPTSLMLYRRGKNCPEDDRMMRICLLAEFPTAEGLLLLNMWRSAGDTRRAYSDLLKKLGQHSLQSPLPSQVKNAREHA